MSGNSGGTDIPIMKARKMNKKMPFLGQRREERHISSSGMNEGYLAQNDRNQENHK